MIRAVLRHPLRFHRDHRFTRTQASAYLDGELRADDRGRIDSHTHMCPPCARFMAGLRRTVSALGRLRNTEAPQVSVSDGVLARLRDEPHIDGGGAPPPV
jgi:anti-sigma factor RsiW